MKDTALQALEWAKHAGLFLLVWQIVSSLMTHFYRDRSKEELVGLQQNNPWVYKLLMLSKAAGLDSPATRQILLGVLFGPLAAAAARDDSKTRTTDPPPPPVAD